MPTISFRQIEDPVPGEGRDMITLIGTCGPTDRMSFGGEQRVDIEWTSGGRVANVMYGGPEEEPLELTFLWRSSRYSSSFALLNGSPLPTIASLCKALDQMRVDMALIEVDWRGRKQTGVFKRFVWHEGSEGVVSAEMRVEWVARPESSPEPPRRPIPQPPRSFAQRLSDGFETFVEGAEAIATFGRAQIESVNDRISEVRAGIERIRVAADSILRFGTDAIGIQRSIAAGLSQVILASTELAGAVAQSPAQFAQTDDAWAQIKASSYIARMNLAARHARHLCVQEQRAYATDEQNVRVHVCVKNETLWSVSVKYYQSSQYAIGIARWNKLPTIALRPGQTLKIPTLEALRASA